MFLLSSHLRICDLDENFQLLSIARRAMSHAIRLIRGVQQKEINREEVKNALKKVRITNQWDWMTYLRNSTKTEGNVWWKKYVPL